MIKMFFNVLPVIDQEITIPSKTYVSYAMCDDRRANIENGRINAYFTGNVMNVEPHHRINEHKYHRVGDLNLDPNGAPY